MDTSCELLVKISNKGPFKKGYIISVKDSPCRWGTKERPPYWLLLRISDANRTQIQKLASRQFIIPEVVDQLLARKSKKLKYVELQEVMRDK